MLLLSARPAPSLRHGTGALIRGHLCIRPAAGYVRALVRAKPRVFASRVRNTGATRIVAHPNGFVSNGLLLPGRHVPLPLAMARKPIAVRWALTTP